MKGKWKCKIESISKHLFCLMTPYNAKAWNCAVNIEYFNVIYKISMAYSGQCANFFSFDSILRNRTKIDELNFSDYVKCTCS